MRTVIATTEPEQRILNGDVRECLRGLPDGSVQCAITSIPYWGLRSYNTAPQIWGGSIDCSHEWSSNGFRHKGGPQGAGGQRSDRDVSAQNAAQTLCIGDTCGSCGAWRGELGSEPTPELFVAHVVEVFREVRRVLRPDGTLWLNIGDTYATGAGSGRSMGGKVFGKQNDVIDAGSYPQCQPNRMPIPGLKPKDIVGIPWMCALALRADGWWLRDEVIWSKPNPMPSSVEDRTTRAHEQIFLLTKNANYFYDADANREPVTSTGGASFGKQNQSADGTGASSRKLKSPEERNHPLGRNKRSVWTIATQSFDLEMCKACRVVYQRKEFRRLPKIELNGRKIRVCRCGRSDAWLSHFATYPARLVMPCVMAGTSERGCCAACGTPWLRVVDVSYENPGNRSTNGPRSITKNHKESPGFSERLERRAVTIGWKPGCDCGAETVPCVVLDPFAGSGTSLQVARHLGRRGIGCELNPDYVELAVARINEPIKLPKEKRKRRVREMRQRELWSE